MGATLIPIELVAGRGTAATKNHGVASGEVPLMDAVGYPAANGSQITGVGGASGLKLEQTITFGGNTINWLSLPAGITHMLFSARGVSTSGGGRSKASTWIQLGNATGYILSGYVGLVTRDGKDHLELSTDIRLDFSDQTRTITREIHGEFWKMDGENWAYHFVNVYPNGSDILHTTGRVTLPSRLVALRFQAGRNFDGGVGSLYTNKS